MRKKSKNLAAAMMMQAMPIFVAAAGLGLYKADPEFVYAKALLERAGVDAETLAKPKVQSLNQTYDGIAASFHK